MTTLRSTFIKAVTRLHTMIFRATNGRLTANAGGMPVLMLTTTGRRSGKAHVAMLTSPYQDGEKVLVVASYGGNDRHPAWFLNLRDRPDVDVVMQGRSGPMRARILTPAEKAEIWPRVIEKYSGYAAYQQRTVRDIPLVMLEPSR